MTKCDGNLETAKKLIKRTLKKNTKLMDRLVDSLVSKAIDTVVGHEHRDANRSAFKDADEPAGRASEIARLLLSEVVLGTSGCVLSKATRIEVTREAEFQHKQSHTMAKKALFFTSIASRLCNDHVTVGEVLSESDLRRLFEHARLKLSEA